MNEKGFAAMYMVYSLFLIFILMMLTVLLINNYKASFLNALKNDIKEDLREHHLEKKEVVLPENEEKNAIKNLKNLLIRIFGVIIIGSNEGRDL